MCSHELLLSDACVYKWDAYNVHDDDDDDYDDDEEEEKPTENTTYANIFSL